MNFSRPFLGLLLLSAFTTSTGSKFTIQSIKKYLFFNLLKPTSFQFQCVPLAIVGGK